MERVAGKLAFQYDREADILYIGNRPAYAEQESEELGDDVIARINPETGGVKASKSCSSPRGCWEAISSSCPSQRIFMGPVSFARNSIGGRFPQLVRAPSSGLGA